MRGHVVCEDTLTSCPCSNHFHSSEDAVPDLLRAYGEMLRGQDSTIIRVFVTVTVGATAFVVLFAIGSLLGQLRKAWLRARRPRKHLRS